MADGLSKLVQRFREHLRHERRASDHTVAAYGRDLDALTAFVRERSGGEAELSDVDRMLLRSWLGELARLASPPTIARKLASLRAFFAYLEREGIARENPAKLLQSPK